MTTQHLTLALEPRFSPVQSFYGKAHVTKTGMKTILRSYNTAVAEYDPNTRTVKLLGQYSSTTTRHQKEFLKQLGFNDFKTTKEMFDKYLDNELDNETA